MNSQTGDTEQVDIVAVYIPEPLGTAESQPPTKPASKEEKPTKPVKAKTQKTAVKH